jgi:hypothetical protein
MEKAAERETSVLFSLSYGYGQRYVRVPKRGFSGFAMLTRSAAEAAAAAAASAAIVASAASAESQPARGLDGRRRARRYTREGNGVLHRSPHIVSRFRSLLLLARMAPVRVGRARVCFEGRHRPTRLLRSKPRDPWYAAEAAEATIAAEAAAAAAASATERVSIAKPEETPSRLDFGTS